MLKGVWNFFLISFLIFVTIIYISTKGIYIKDLSIFNIKISHLYIKLDKKFIINSEEIIIPKVSKVQSSYEKSNIYIQYIPHLLTIFKDIEIKSLKIGDNNFKVKVDQSIFFIENNFIKIKSKPIIKKKIVELEIYELYSKVYNLNFDGKITANLKTEEISFDGKVTYKDKSLNLKTVTKEEKIEFEISSINNFSSIDFIKDFVRLDPIIEDWMYKNVQGDVFLKYLKGEVDKETFFPDLKTFEGFALIKDSKVKFHEELEEINSPLIEVSFKDDNLYFELISPTYKNIELKNSKVTIYSISDKKKPSYLKIDFNIEHYLSQEVLDLLKKYEVSLPIIQLDGKTKSELEILVFLKDMDVEMKGMFETQNSRFSLQGFEFLAKNALVELNNSMVKIKSSHINVENFIDGELLLDIDTYSEIAKGEVKINNLEIKTKEGQEIIKMNDKKTDVFIDYKKITKVEFEQLNTNFEIYDLYTKIFVRDLNYVKDYSKLLQSLKVEKGRVELDYFNENKINFISNIQSSNFPFFSKNGERIKKLKIEGKIEEFKTEIKSENNEEEILIKIKENEKKVWLKNIDIKNEESNSKEEIEIQIKGENSNIITNEGVKILGDNYTLKNKNGEIIVNLSHKGGELIYIKSILDKVVFSAKKMNNEFINSILGGKIFQEGEFDIRIEGVEKGEFKGEIKIKNSKVKDLAVINNLTTFINMTPTILNPLLSIPSLTNMIINGGINLTSYKIKEGVVKFTYNEENDIVYINELNFIGDSVDFKSVGTLDLRNKKIDCNVSIILLKEYGMIIKHIPIINSLILGDDKEILMNVNVYGDFKDPKVEANILKEATIGTFNFFKRVITLPFKPFFIFSDKKE